MSVELNQPIPDFSASATGEQTVTPASLAGKKVVIYFYPKDNTPGCTTEGQDFRDNHEAFTEASAVIYGVSRDSLRTHTNFKTKHEFPFELISDPDESFCRLFELGGSSGVFGRQIRRWWLRHPPARQSGRSPGRAAPAPGRRLPGFLRLFRRAVPRAQRVRPESFECASSGGG